MLKRSLTANINHSLQNNPAVVILGPRQVGKTTLALQQVTTTDKEKIYLDLERPSDLFKLEDPEFFLTQHQDKLVIIDEVQRKPDLFPILRSLIDENRAPGRFLLLGSASDALISLSSESLAGRISYKELHPFSVAEVPASDFLTCWVRGGYPNAFLAQNDEAAFEWLNDFVRTYIERELGATGLRVSPQVLAQFLRILASVHGQLTNYSQLAQLMQVSTAHIKNYIHFFEQSYILRVLNPYAVNLQKRLVKTPKVYIRDSGILHYLWGINSLFELEGNFHKGESWEGFAIQQIISQIKPSILPYFYRTSSGAEIDLLLVKGNQPFAAFEFKYSNSPKLTKGNTEAFKDLSCPHQYIVTPSAERFQLRSGIQVVSLLDIPQILQDLGLLL
jgi:predicted AAA+ superfamily ATPase